MKKLIVIEAHYKDKPLDQVVDCFSELSKLNIDSDMWDRIYRGKAVPIVLPALTERPVISRCDGPFFSNSAHIRDQRDRPPRGGFVCIHMIDLPSDYLSEQEI